jgi:lysophospholipid acyltransferase (LPLAT)-like uncharacterized protein
VKIRSRWLTKCLAWLLVQVSLTLMRSCRRIYLAPDPWWRLDDDCEAGRDRYGVLCVWHDLLLIPTFAAIRAKRVKTCCLVSKHQDGTYLADVMGFLGYTTVRGSTQRGGAAAVKQLIADTAGKHIVITPDGPRGPRRVLKPGAIYVASQTGKPLYVGAYACSHAWTIRGRWTDAMIPKPFSTVYVVTSRPIPIPPHVSRDQLRQVDRLSRGEIERIEFEPAGDSATRAA